MAIDETRATIQGGGELLVVGATISDLYGTPSDATTDQVTAPTQQVEEPPAEEPKPEPEPLPSKTALRKMTPAQLKALCEQRGIAVSGKTSKAKMVAALLAD